MYVPTIPETEVGTLLTVFVGHRSAAIDKLSKLFPNRASVGIAYFYFDFKEPGKQNARNMVLSLLGQLCTHQSTIPHCVQTLYQKEMDHEPPSIANLTVALFDIVKTFKRTFLVIDALDECIERPVLLATLCTIVQHQHGKHLKVLVASREEQNIRASFASLPFLSIRTQMSSDIGLYITESIDTDTRLSSLPEEIKLEINGTISEGAKGMYVAIPLAEGRFAEGVADKNQVPVGRVSTRKYSLLP